MLFRLRLFSQIQRRAGMLTALLRLDVVKVLAMPCVSRDLDHFTFFCFSLMATGRWVFLRLDLTSWIPVWLSLAGRLSSPATSSAQFLDHPRGSFYISFPRTPGARFFLFPPDRVPCIRPTVFIWPSRWELFRGGIDITCCCHPQSAFPQVDSSSRSWWATFPLSFLPSFCFLYSTLFTLTAMRRSPRFRFSFAETTHHTPKVNRVLFSRAPGFLPP